MDKAKLTSHILALAKPQGFRRHGSDTFRRVWPGGFDAIVPMTVRRAPELKLDFSLNIRHDDVEELLERLDPGPRGPAANQVTTLTHVGDILRQGAMGDLFWRLTPATVEPALQEFGAFLRGQGAAHFQRLRDPVALERTFNADPDAPCVDCRDDVRRVLRGIALASLHRPAELDAVAEAYRRRVEKTWHPGRLVPRFHAVLAGLR